MLHLEFDLVDGVQWDPAGLSPRLTEGLVPHKGPPVVRHEPYYATRRLLRAPTVVLQYFQAVRQHDLRFFFFNRAKVVRSGSWISLSRLFHCKSQTKAGGIERGIQFYPRHGLRYFTLPAFCVESSTRIYVTAEDSDLIPTRKRATTGGGPKTTQHKGRLAT